MNPLYSSPRRSLDQISSNGEVSVKASAVPVALNLPGEQNGLDYSIFSSKEGDLFEPIAIDHHRAPSQQAALNYTLRQSIEFLFDGPTEPGLHSSDRRSLRGIYEIGKTHGTLSSMNLDDGDSGTVARKRKRDDDDSSQSSRSVTPKFRHYYVEQWDERYEDLIKYRNENHHCCVPYDFPPNPTLARWVKRQRYQYKLLVSGKPSAMTEQRMKALEKIGFIWDALDAVWERRLVELRAYHAEHGDCNVVASSHPRLASWVKCQRRQYKLYRKGGPSPMTKHRAEALDQLGFEWECPNVSIPQLHWST